MPAAPTRPAPTTPGYALVAPFDTAGLAAEWLLTDGRGGFAMGTPAGVPTRRYHALFIAATKPPVGRIALLNASVDQLIVHPDTPQALPIELSSFRFAGSERLHPDGSSRVASFTKHSGVEWVCELPMARITRSLHLHRDHVAATLRYTVERRGTAAALAPSKPTSPLRLTIRPLVSLRDMHALIRRDWADRFGVHPSPDGRACRVERDGLRLHLRSDSAAFRHDQQWWFNFLYAEDAARGQDCIEDLFSPGAFALDIPAGQDRAELLLRASIDDLPPPTLADIERDAAARAQRLARARAHIAAPQAEPWLDALIAAADDFVVARQPQGISVIAGYPWFSDWGRDTFISLPGLMLATGRHDDARATLLAFAAHRKHGLIPNVFNDQTGEAEYNTVDGPLWFIHAACAWRECSPSQREGAGGIVLLPPDSPLTNDSAWTDHLLPACLDIIAHYRKGTGGDLNIAMDPFDKLITAGTSATQLTWMDARRDGVTFTPRYGKAVEINALWISALKRLSLAMAPPPTDSRQSANLSDLAEAASRSFRKSFWNEHDQCLFDVLTPSDSERGPVAWTPDAAIRPNQIFAVSLPHSPLAPEQQRVVIDRVREHLLTPMGLRTLSPRDSRYRGRYEGNLFQRDAAYHQGTAWPWLLGPLAEAVLRVGGFSAQAREQALAILQPTLSTLESANFARDPRACAGHIAEIFDGDAPQRPQGCPAQAWSVAELLRVLVCHDVVCSETAS